MNIRKAVLILLILAISVNLFGCSKKHSKDKDDLEIIRSDDELNITEEDDMRDTILYFQNKNGFLVPVMRKIPWEEGIAKLALKNMIDSPALRENLAPTGLVPIIPAGVEIIGMTIDEDTGVCKVDFTEEILNYETEKDEENLIKGIVYTLTEFPSIREVCIFIDGNDVPTFKYGTEAGKPLTREGINLVQEFPEANSNIIVYLKGTDNGEFEYYVPVTVPTIAPAPNMYTALEKLFEGSFEEYGLHTDIPQEVSLQGIEVRDGIAYVDLSVDSIDTINDQNIIEGMAKNIALTLSQFEDIEKVEMLIDGKNFEEVGLDFECDEAIPAFANHY